MLPLKNEISQAKVLSDFALIALPSVLSINALPEIEISNLDPILFPNGPQASDIQETLPFKTKKRGLVKTH
jgi:hypothetical protein